MIDRDELLELVDTRRPGLLVGVTVGVIGEAIRKHASLATSAAQRRIIELESEVATLRAAQAVRA